MRKRLLAGVALSALIAAPALAADFAVKRPIYEPAWAWTGFYVGLQAGYGWSNSTVDVTSLGFLMTDHFLVYATGGLAYGQVSAETSLSGSLCATVIPPFLGIGFPPPPATGCGSGSAVGSLSERRFGSAFGGGLQYAISRNW